MGVSKMRLTESEIREIVKESVRNVLREANKVSPKRTAMDDMERDNEVVRNRNRKARENNRKLDAIDDYQRGMMSHDEDPKRISWRTDKRGRCMADDSYKDHGNVSMFMYNTRDMKDSREDLAKIIRGEKARPDEMEYEELPYDTKAFDNRHGDIGKAIESDVETLDAWRDIEDWF